MKPVSLADISYEQGLKLLELRKQAMDAGHIRRMPPAALANTLPLAGIGSSFMKQAEGDGIVDKLLSGWNSMDPASRNVLMSGAAGTGLGALAGLGSGYTSGEGNYLSRALRGGLAGGAIGGGIGLAANPDLVRKFLPNKAKLAPKEQATGAPKLSEKAEEILRAPAEARNEKLQDLQATSSSWYPELTAGAGAAGTLGLTGGAAYKLKNMKSYDPHALADKIHTDVSGLARNAIPKDYNTSAFGKLIGSPPTTAATFGESVLEAAHSGAVDPAGLAGRLTGQHALGAPSTFLHKMRPETQQLLSDFVRNDDKKLKSLIDAAHTSGFKNRAGKIRWGRSGLAGLAGILGTSGLGYLLGNYLNNRGERADAQRTLNELSTATQNQP